MVPCQGKRARPAFASVAFVGDLLTQPGEGQTLIERTCIRILRGREGFSEQSATIEQVPHAAASAVTPAAPHPAVRATTAAAPHYGSAMHDTAAPCHHARMRRHRGGVAGRAPNGGSACFLAYGGYQHLTGLPSGATPSRQTPSSGAGSAEEARLGCTPHSR